MICVAEDNKSQNMNIIELVKSFDAKQWRKLGHWKKSLMLDWIETTSLGLDNFMSIGLDWHIDNYGFVVHTAMMAEDDFQATKHFFEGKLAHEYSFAIEHGQRCYETGNKLVEFSKKISDIREWQHRATSDLIRYFVEFVSLVSSNIPFFPALIPLEEALDERLRLLLSNHLKARDISIIHLFDYLSILSAPKRVPEMIANREALLRLGEQIQSDREAHQIFSTNDTASIATEVGRLRPDLWAAVERYVKDYGWLGSFGWVGKPISESDVFGQLQEVIHANCADQILKLHAERESTAHAIETSLNDLNASQEFRNFIEIIREYAYLRLFRIDIYNKAYFYASPLFNEIARRLNLTTEQLLFLTPPEVRRHLEADRPVDLQIIDDREHGFTILMLDGHLSLLAGNDFESFEQSRQKEDYGHLTTVQGDPIFKGKVQGVVKVVMDSSSLPKINRGDILVAPMTNPDFTPVFGKIAGIVTDEGGVLCHAAIVAREYRLPCIISTKIATKVFKDNDFILLDATAGSASKTDQPSSQQKTNERQLEQIALSVTGKDFDVGTERTLIYWFDNDGRHILPEVGSKFNNLAILHKHDFHVPPAFCITTSAFRYFLHYNNLTESINQALSDLDFNQDEQVGKLSSRIRILIENGHIPPLLLKGVEEALRALGSTAVSVRSSSTSEDLAQASFAGVYDSFLNIIGIEQVVVNIKACWASLFSVRSLYYFHEQLRQGRLSGKDVAIAVIVQDLVNADKSGICFTANPESLQYDEIVIQAAFGLGEGVVSGEVASDLYVVKKGTWKLLSRRKAEAFAAIVPDRAGGVRAIKMAATPGESPVLSEEEVADLARISSRIEAVFGSPQDIEWAKDRSLGFFILQSRPITTFHQ